MSDKITILGSGTCNLDPKKAAASVLLEKGELRLVYDFGRGTAIRLVEAGLKQDDVQHIFLSHFHPDHVTDLFPYLHAASWSQIDARTKDLNIYGPLGTKDFLRKMFSVFGQKELGRNFAITVHELRDGKFGISKEEFLIIDLHHSRGLRFGTFAIAGDAQVNTDLENLLRGVEVGVFDAGHITDDEICEVAAKTQAKTLICSHQYRPLNEKKLNKQAKSLGYTGTIVVAEDLMSFTV
jgi:ribonuclease BN (tRNA processing enzyme)